MNLLEQKQREIGALKSKLKIQEEKLSLQEQKIASLEKQNPDRIVIRMGLVVL